MANRTKIDGKSKTKKNLQSTAIATRRSLLASMRDVIGCPRAVVGRPNVAQANLNFGPKHTATKKVEIAQLKALQKKTVLSKPNEGKKKQTRNK